MLCLFASCVFVSNSIQTSTPLFKIVQFWSSQVVVSSRTSLNLELKSRWQANLSIDLRNPSMKRHHFIQTQRTSFCFQLLISKPLITGTELLDKCHWKVCSQQETIAIYISSRHCLEKHQRALHFFFFTPKAGQLFWVRIEWCNGWRLYRKSWGSVSVCVLLMCLSTPDIWLTHFNLGPEKKI